MSFYLQPAVVVRGPSLHHCLDVNAQPVLPDPLGRHDAQAHAALELWQLDQLHLGLVVAVVAANAKRSLLLLHLLLLLLRLRGRELAVLSSLAHLYATKKNNLYTYIGCW